MTNPFQIEFKLRQHTPIIHFQHDQSGATLRISELKPAFDRYLWEKVLKKDFNYYKSCLVGYSAQREDILRKEFEKENWALDYRITIDYVEPDIKPMGNRFSCFFGDLGENGQHLERQFSFIYQDFAAKFYCFHTLLRRPIETYFHDFLRTKNFGLRQSKGFGSFTTLLPRKNDQGLAPVTPATNSYRFQVRGHNDKNLFSHIDLFWKVIRSGFNKPDRDRNTVVYIKSPLFFYLKNKWTDDIDYEKYPQYSYLKGQAAQLEKRTIKQTYFTKRLSDQQRRHDFSDILEAYAAKSSNTYFLFRDLFGLASSSQWLGYSPNSITKEHVPLNGAEKIDRFKSPIIIKPIKTDLGFDVYVCYAPIPEGYSGQKFKILAGSQDRLTVETPPKGSFLFSKYFQFLLDEFKWKIAPKDDIDDMPDPTVVTLIDPNDPDWLKIKSIFQSFKKV